MPQDNLATPIQPPAQRTCCLCEGADFEIINTRDRRKGSLVTVMCQECGLISHRDLPSDTQLNEYYASEYRFEYHGERLPAARRVMRAWKNGQRVLQLLEPHVRKTDSVLEIGAGLGCTVRNFQEAGYDVAGIDPGRDFTEFSINQLGANMLCQSLADLDGSKPRDFILLVHVIEHLNAPHHALMKIHRLLKPGGQVYIECPNLDAPVSRRNQLFHFAHVYSFTPATLKMLAQRCGFELVQQFGHDKQAHLQMLFRRTESRSVRIDGKASQRTLRRIRMGRLRYHLRPAYLLERVRKLTSYAVEHLFAEKYVARLIDRCKLERTTPAQSEQLASAAETTTDTDAASPLVRRAA